ncbi:MAG: glycosyltransferase family 39 protein [Candidatus Pacebacteria bacterium]|nr:glycosyltransferase family 39 protein [Candidatus Paceibacterota bacterium]
MNKFLSIIFNKKNWIISIFILFLSTLFIFSLLEITNPMIGEGDAYSRAIISKRLFDKGQLFNLGITNTWLPLHFSLLNILSSFNLNIFTSQRIVTSIFSILSIYSLYLYSKEVFKDQKVAILSGVIFGLLPLRIILSTQTLSETTFLFFFILAMLFLIKRHTTKNLLFFMILFNLSAAIRFESWLIIPLIILYLILNNKINKNIKFLYFLSLLLFPITWIINNFKDNGTLFYFFNNKYNIAQRTTINEFYNLNLSIKAWEGQLLQLFPIEILIITIFSYKYLFKKLTLKKAFSYFLPIYLYIILILQVFLGTMEWFPHRYLLIPLTFLIPILANYLIIVSKKIIKAYKKNNKKYLFILIGLIIISLSLYSYSELYKSNQKILTILSFHNLKEDNPTNNFHIENKQYFDQIVKEINKQNFSNKKNIKYFYRDKYRTFHDQALFYFTDSDGYDVNKNKINTENLNNFIIVWEREYNKFENELPSHLTKAYENKNYFILTNN